MLQTLKMLKFLNLLCFNSFSNCFFKAPQIFSASSTTKELVCVMQFVDTEYRCRRVQALLLTQLQHLLGVVWLQPQDLTSYTHTSCYSSCWGSVWSLHVLNAGAGLAQTLSCPWGSDQPCCSCWSPWAALAALWLCAYTPR